jgi:hypothetical protein
MTQMRTAPPFPGTTSVGPNMPGWASVGPVTDQMTGYYYGGAIPAAAPTFASSVGQGIGIGAGIAGTYAQPWNGMTNPSWGNTYVTNGYLTAAAAPVTSRGSDTLMPVQCVTATPSIYGTALAPAATGPVTTK